MKRGESRIGDPISLRARHRADLVRSNEGDESLIGVGEENNFCVPAFRFILPIKL